MRLTPEEEAHRPKEGILHLIEREVLARPVSRELYNGVRAARQERPVSRGLVGDCGPAGPRKCRQERPVSRGLVG